MGKIILASDPIDANQPRSVPCGLRPTTARIIWKMVDETPQVPQKLLEYVLLENKPTSAVWPMGYPME
jgi:hypothetical protein